MKDWVLVLMAPVVMFVGMIIMPVGAKVGQKIIDGWEKKARREEMRESLVKDHERRLGEHQVELLRLWRQLNPTKKTNRRESDE